MGAAADLILPLSCASLSPSGSCVLCCCRRRRRRRRRRRVHQVGVDADGVSGQHLRLSHGRDGALLATDLGSTNGTALKKGWGGGKEFEPNTEYELADGSSVVLATQVTLSVSAPAAAGAQRAAAEEPKPKARPSFFGGSRAPAPAKPEAKAAAPAAEPKKGGGFSLFGPLQPGKAGDGSDGGGKDAPFQWKQRATPADEEEEEEEASKKAPLFSFGGSGKVKSEPKAAPAPASPKTAPASMGSMRGGSRRGAAGEEVARQWVLSSPAIEGGKIALPPRGGVTLGSGADKAADVVVDNENVSSQHVRIEVGADGELEVTDLDSTNGTQIKAGFFSNTSLEPMEPATLAAGSQLVLSQRVAISAAYVPVDEDVPVARGKGKASGGGSGFKFPSFSFGGKPKAETEAPAPAAPAMPAPKPTPKPRASFTLPSFKAPTAPVAAADDDEEEEEQMVAAPQRGTSPALRGLWAATEAAGNAAAGQDAEAAADEEADQQEQEDDGLPPLSMRQARSYIEQDYAVKYFVSGEGELDAYTPDCLFSDDFGSYRGTERFKRNVRNLGKYIEEGTLLLDTNLDEDDEGNLVSKWRFSAILSLPWRPRLSASGSTTHVFNSKNYVVQHNERWDVEPAAVLKGLLKPSAAEPTTAWEKGMLALAEGNVGGLWAASSDGVALVSAPIVVVSIACKALTGSGLPGTFLGAIEGLAWLGFVASAFTQYALSRPEKDSAMPEDLEDAERLLERCAAADGGDVGPEAVGAAATLIEEAEGYTRPTKEQVDGTWYLAFSSGLSALPVLEGYMPVDEAITIDFEGSSISLSTDILPGLGDASPNFEMLQGDTFRWDETKSSLTFNMKMGVNGEVKKIKSWDMLYCSDTCLVARSSGTGLNVLRRLSSPKTD